MSTLKEHSTMRKFQDLSQFQLPDGQMLPLVWKKGTSHSEGASDEWCEFKLHEGALHVGVTDSVDRSRLGDFLEVKAAAGHLPELLDSRIEFERDTRSGVVRLNQLDSYLWLPGVSMTALSGSEGLRVALPAGWVLPEKGILNLEEMHCVAKNIRSLGYRGLMIGVRSDLPVEEINSEECDLGQLVSLFHQYGIKIGVRLHLPSSLLFGCAKDEKYREEVKELIGNWLKGLESHPDLLAWEPKYGERCFVKRTGCEQMLVEDFLLSELQLAEEIVGATDAMRLMFIFAWGENQGSIDYNQQARLIDRFAEEVGPKTALAFSAYDGHSGDESTTEPGGLHPLWEHLRCKFFPNRLPIFPMLDMTRSSSIESQKGSLDKRVDQVFSPVNRKHYSGAIVMANSVPAREEIIAGALWSTGWALDLAGTVGCCPGSLFGTWLRTGSSR